MRAHRDRRPGAPIGLQRPLVIAGVTLALVASTLGCTRAGTTDQGSSTTSSGGVVAATAPDATTPGWPTTSVPGPVTASSPDPSADDVADPAAPGLGDPRIDVVHYDLTVRADPGRPEISGEAVLTLEARTSGPLDSFTLDLRGPTVSAAEVDGRPAPVTTDGTELTISPVRPLPPGKPVEVSISYAGTPAAVRWDGLDVRQGWQPDQQGGWFTMSEPDGTSTWAPVSNHLSDKATWRITLDTPEDSTGVSNGRLVSSDRAAGRRRWVWEQDHPMATYLALAAVGDYDLEQRTGPADIAMTFAFPRSLDQTSRAGFDAGDDMIRFFAATFGPYPDDDGGAIVVGAYLSVALEAQTRPLFGLDGVRGGQVHALAHELAHQWFGDAVTPATWGDLWLNEGVATYADFLWREHHDGADLEGLLTDDESPLYGTDLPVWSAEAARTFDPSLYGGGARALHALRWTVGDENFFSVLRRWLRRYGGANASTEDFVALAEEVSGQDLTTWTDDWLLSEGQPALPS